MHEARPEGLDLGVDGVMGRASCGVAVFDSSLRFVYVNASLVAFNGRPAAEILGRHPLELDNSEATLRWVRLASAVLTSGEALGPERFSRGRGMPVLELSFHPMVTGGSVTGVVGLVWDVTATARTEGREQILLRATAALARTSTVEEIASVVVTNVVTYLADRVTFGVVEGDELVVIDLEGYPSQVTDKVRGSRVRLDEPYPACEAVTSGELIIFDAATFDRRYPELAPRRAEIGDQVIAVVPIANGETVLGVLVAGWSSPDEGRTADVDAIVALAAVTQGATRRVRLAQAVADDQFRRALNATGDAITIAQAVRDPDSGAITDFVITYANDNRSDAYGRTLSDLVGRSVLATYPAFRSAGLFDRFKQVVDTGEPFTALEYPYRDPAMDPPLVTWNELHVVRFDDGYLASSRDVTRAVEMRRELDRARIAAASERHAVQILRRAGLSDVLPTHRRYEIAAAYQPFHETAPIGGDWYDVFPLDDNRLGIIIGDVSGHGQDAAVAMIEMRSLLGAAARTGSGPDEVLSRVRQAQFRNDTMITCLYAIVDHRAGTISIASAGHPPPLIGTPHGPATYLKLKPQPPLGLDLPARDEIATEPVEPGMSLVFFTDGLIERPTESIDVGLARLAHTFQPDLSPREQCDLLAGTIADPDARDDYCLVVLTLNQE